MNALIKGLTSMAVVVVAASAAGVEASAATGVQDARTATSYRYQELPRTAPLELAGYLGLQNFALGSSGEQFALLFETFSRLQPVGEISIYEQRAGVWRVNRSEESCGAVSRAFGRFRWSGSQPTFAWWSPGVSCDTEARQLSVARHVDGNWQVTKIAPSDIGVPATMEVSETATTASGVTLILFQTFGTNNSCLVRWDASVSAPSASACGIEFQRTLSWIDGDGVLRVLEGQRQRFPYARIVEKTLRGSSFVETAVLDDSAVWWGELSLDVRGDSFGATAAWETVDATLLGLRRVVAARRVQQGWEPATVISGGVPFEPFLKDLGVGTSGQGCVLIQGGRSDGPLRGVINTGGTWKMTSGNLWDDFATGSVSSTEGCALSSWTSYSTSAVGFFNESGGVRPPVSVMPDAFGLWRGSTFVLPTTTSPAAALFSLSVRQFALTPEPSRPGKVVGLRITRVTEPTPALLGVWKPPSGLSQSVTYQYRTVLAGRAGDWVTTSKTKTRPLRAGSSNKAFKLEVRAVVGSLRGPIAVARFP